MFVRNRAPIIEGVTILPDQRELVSTFGGQPPDPDQDHPLLPLARELAELHRQRHRDPLATAGIDCRRAELVTAIDNWVSTRVPRRQSTAHIRDESIGATVDRMAAAHAHASHLLHTAEKVADDRVHAAWYRLALLVDHWTDLITGSAHNDSRARQSA
ncbi:DUF4254 domain-containing protein [Nocardia sp. NBC_00565]|uniref:DUF4254 domain-containing protein n=1 Tax=Nocardia sp. NBC_00565 TaxID=2975993 RepID=UPI002E81874B|nr:DUF4254 domain-containing protein [Nocardia sp. NBC_00565]WUC00825.1 DUF4254 domain-containing protein [Nocardia sp. NBC_00565]